MNEKGELVQLEGLLGMQASIGAYGHRTWKRTTLQLDYSGDFRHYTENTYLDGSDHMFSLGLSRQVSRRVQVFSRTGAGTTSRYYALGPSVSDVGTIPGFGVFDNRAFYLQNVTGVQFNPTLRWSYVLTGTGYGVRRQSQSLVGMNGYGATGMASYRLSRSRSINLFYGFMHYDYQRGFGDSDIHNSMAGLTQKFGRRWEGSLSGGVAQIHTVGLERVASDPILVALFGNATFVRAFDRTVAVGAAEASLTGTYRRSLISFSYSQMPNAGNGIYLTSKNGVASARYTYSGIRKSSVSLVGTYTTYKSIGQEQLGAFNQFGGGATLSYKLTRALEASCIVDARNLQIDNSGLNRNAYRISFGLNFHSSEMPIVFK